MRRLATALFASVFVLAAFVPSGARAATAAALPAQSSHVTAALGMTCSFPDDPTGGAVCKVVLTVVGVVCRNRCLLAGDSSATPATTRAVHLSRLYAIN
jgi:hypothetical protein